jgi:hypothetical protein
VLTSSTSPTSIAPSGPNCGPKGAARHVVPAVLPDRFRRLPSLPKPPAVGTLRVQAYPSRSWPYATLVKTRLSVFSAATMPGVRIPDRATHAWGALGLAVALGFGVPSFVAIGHYKRTPWWAVAGILLAAVFFLAALFLFVSPLLGKRTRDTERPSPQKATDPADTPQQVVQAPEATGRVAEPAGAAGDEMVYDIRLNPVKEILVRYIYQPADISMLSSQAGLDQGSIAAGGSAVNYWQAVLERACIEGVHKVDAVLDCAIHHLRHTVAEAPLRVAVERYRRDRG